MRRRLPPVVVVTAFVVVGAVPGIAAAYPHYQFSSETSTCRECHHAPAGGGLLTEWGRSELGDTLSMSGDGRLLHGIDEPDWLAVGGDLRLAALVNDTGNADGAEIAVFPMQLELAARVAAGALSVTVIAGARSAARDSETPGDDAGGLGGLALFSREHVITYHRAETPWWVRGGRFAAPFGLRLADHTAYVRRHTGHGLYEETYGVGVSRLGTSADVHVTAFVSDMVQVGAEPAGGAAAMYERRRQRTALVLSGRVTAGGEDMRALADVAFKHWMPGARVLWMAELGGGWQTLHDAGEGRPQVVGYAGPTWIPKRGVNVTLAGELLASDARIAEDNRYAGSLTLSLLPLAHVELLAMTRYQVIGVGDRALTAMFQLHYLP